MKRIMMMTAVLGTVLSMAACGPKEADKQTEPAGTAATAPPAVETTAQLPNPLEEVADAEAVNAIGVAMSVPEGAENTAYTIISGIVGEITFTKDGASYCYRGSSTAADFSGIYEQFEEVEDVVEGSGADHLRIRTTVSRGKLADWEKNGVKYTLYTPDDVETGSLIELCVELIGQN